LPSNSFVFWFIVVVRYYLVHDVVSDGSDMTASKVIIACTNLFPFWITSVDKVLTIAVT